MSLNSWIINWIIKPLLCIGVLSISYSAATQPAATNNPNSNRFLSALPGYQFSFPRDHGSHPDYQTEWWYYTGHLRAEDGHQFGYELTFFRYGLTSKVAPERSAWAVRDVIFAHFAITDQTGQKYFYTERMERANMGLAAAEIGKPHFLPRVWIDNWDLQFQGNNGNTQIIKASGNAQDPQSTLMAIDLTQKAIIPPIINGQNGISKKGSSQNAASHYYSMPRLQTAGILQLGDKKYQVSGESWLDREYGSGGLSPGQRGWDWFAIQLNDGRNLMLYQIRDKNGKPTPYSAGTITDSAGKSTFITQEDFKITVTQQWKSPHTQATYPAQWIINVPRYNLSLQITPTLADQEMRPRYVTVYWEGSCHVENIITDESTSKSIFTPVGKAYVELTGY